MNKTAPTTPATPTAAKPKKRTPYPHLFRLLHWVLPISLVVAVATGLSLNAVSQGSWSLFSGGLPVWLWSGQVQVIHLIAAVVFLPSLIAVLMVYWRRKVRRRATHVALLAGGLAMIVSGVLLLHPTGPAQVYWIARAVHFVAGVLVLPVALLWHVVDGLGRLRGALVPAFRPWASPRWRHLLYLLPLVLVAVCLVGNVLPPSMVGRQLVATRIDTEDTGDLISLPWDDAAPLQMELAGGVGFDRGRTQVTLRALHDGNELFVLAEWRDPTEDRRYKPWQKTDDGWRHLESDTDDECVFYEDKFSLAFPIAPDWRFEQSGCALYCHIDSRHSYGYKGADRTVDVWHWKATRTDPVGQVDDKYWLGVDANEKTRHGDKKEGGGYRANTIKGEDRPAFLPDKPEVALRGAIPSEHAVDYTEQAAKEIPTGTIVPGIVVAAFEGHRGDVTCRSQYEDGRWRLYIRRRLDTGDANDVTFAPGGSYAFGCAAFDHTSNRHAYGLSPYRLVLAP